MDKEKILSYLYLHSILPLLEEIVEFDETAKQIVRDWKSSFQFDVHNGPKVSLRFAEGKLEVKREKGFLPTVAFWFPNFSSLNRMIEGKKVIPPWKGVWHFSLLKKFDSLTKRIEYYLRPEEKLLQQEENLKFHLKLTLWSMLWGIKIVAENDDSFKIKRALSVIHRFPSSVFQIEILPEGPNGYLMVADGKIMPYKGKHPSPTSIFQIKDINIARQMFQRELDFMVGLGTLDLRIIGLIPFAEAISIIMDRLSEYIPK